MISYHPINSRYFLSMGYFWIDWIVLFCIDVERELDGEALREVK